MGSTESVSVVIPVFNRQRTIQRALASLARQTLPIRSLVVVDDGSSDESSSAVTRWLQDRAVPFRWQVVRRENGGAAAARNTGLATLEDCEFIVLLDSDDLLPADFVQRAASSLVRHPDAVAATCDQQFVTSAGCLLNCRDVRGLSANATSWLIHNDGGINSSTMFRKRFIQLPAFDETLPVAEDLKFYLALSLKGRWLHLPGQPSMIQRGSPEDESRPLSDLGATARMHTALVLDQFLKSDEMVPAAQLYAHRVGHVWYQAGRDLLREGKRDQALHCLRLCHQWNQWHLKAWWHKVFASRTRAS